MKMLRISSKKGGKDHERKVFGNATAPAGTGKNEIEIKIEIKNIAETLDQRIRYSHHGYNSMTKTIFVYDKVHGGSIEFPLEYLDLTIEELKEKARQRRKKEKVNEDTENEKKELAELARLTAKYKKK